MSLVTKIDGVAGVLGTNKRFVRLYATTAIAKGDAVCFDMNATEPTNGYANSIAIADLSAALTSCAIGIAAEAIASGDPGVVQVGGVCAFAKTVHSTAAPGDPLGIHANVGELSVMGADLNLTVAIHIKDGGGSSGAASSTVYLLNPANL